MPTRLANLVIERVDLVDVGANLDKRTGDGSHILLYKRGHVTKRIVERDGEYCVLSEDGSKTLGCHATEAMAQRQLRAVEASKAKKRAQEVLQLAGETLGVGKCGDGYMAGPAQSYEDMLLRRTVGTLYAALSDRFGALLDTVQSIIGSGDDGKEALIRSAVGEFVTSVKAMKSAAEVDKAFVHVYEGLDALAALGPSGEATMPDNKIEIEKAQAEAIKKAVDEALAAQQTAFTAELAKRDVAIAAANKTADDERAKREQREFAELAKSYAPVVQADEAELLRTVAGKIDADAWGMVQIILKRAADQVRQGLLLKQANDDAFETPSDSAEAEILKQADALVVSGKAKSRAQAVDDVLMANPALATRQAEESANRVRKHATRAH